MKNSFTLARALAFVSLAALLAGCKTTSQVELVQSIPDDYRQRHPIAVREKVQSMTVFIGDARGTLTPTQRAEVGALASGWRQEATGGVVIEVPVGSRTSGLPRARHGKFARS
jgi:pilus assembly protein CpaD